MSVDETKTDAELIAVAKGRIRDFARVDLAFRLKQLANVEAGGAIHGGGIDHAEHRALLRQAIIDLEWSTSKPTGVE